MRFANYDGNSRHASSVPFYLPSFRSDGSQQGIGIVDFEEVVGIGGLLVLVSGRSSFLLLWDLLLSRGSFLYFLFLQG